MQELIISRIKEVFPDQQACLDFLLEIYWGNTLQCAFCGCQRLNQKFLKEGDSIGRLGRYRCRACRKTFRLTRGTVFHGTKLPLQHWFIAVVLLDRDQSFKSYDLARSLGYVDPNIKSIWYLKQRVLKTWGDRKEDDTFLERLYTLIGIDSMVYKPFFTQEEISNAKVDRIPFPNIPYCN